VIATFTPPRCRPAVVSAAVAPLAAVLDQLADLLAAMSDEQYRTKPQEVVSGSAGSHVRHCLDHVKSLLSAIDTGILDYDQRQRGTDVETSRTAALAVLRSQQRRLRALPADCADRPLRLWAIVHPAPPPVEAETSVGRELIFVLSHTIHHNALIAVIARALGVSVPERFGYAPSTLAHRETRACAR
jgi:uncharacterized damage-inducible protein DinB